ncbi:MAG: MFS transporter [Bacteroidia bacterium]|nr:MFS transporter [Bacteroidia bacterium]NNK72953.1 MFS transporter [Flavobacteriaceae bacterium]
MDVNSKPTKLTLLLVSSLTIMSMLTISASLPDMAIDYKDNPNGEQLVKMALSFPALFIALSAMIAGPVIDKFGRLKLIGPILVLYAIAGSSGYWLKDLYLILAGRAILGICVGFTMTIATTLIADYYKGQARQQFAGIQIAFMSLAGIVFVSLGGILADMNWRIPFLIYVSSLIVLPLAYMFLREPALDSEEKHREISRAKSPKLIWFVFINVMLMWIIFFIIPIQIPFHLKDIGMESNTAIGLVIASSTFFSAISSFSFGRLKAKFDFSKLFAMGYFLMAVAYVCIAFGNNLLLIMLGMLFSGLGMGLLIPNANVWVMQLAPLEIRGREIGRLTTFWFMGQFLSPLILLPLLEIFNHQQMFNTLAIILGLMACLFFFFQNHSKG